VAPSRAGQIARLLAEAEQDGYRRGWQDAIDALKAKAPVPESALVPPEYIDSPPIDTGKRSSMALVRDLIFDRPGLKGVEIVKALAHQGTPVKERTVRTCLHRLRSDHVIWQRKTLWYPRPVSQEEVNDNHLL
jgi:hypothetical protein